MEAVENQNNSGSFIIPKLDYSITGKDRDIAVMAKQISELQTKFYELETKKIIDESDLPHEILEANGLLPTLPRRVKRGRGYRQILLSEILEAKEHSKNAAGVARYLGVNYKTYKKYAILYGVHEPNPSIRGKRNIYDPERGKYPLNEILAGKHPNITPFKIKDKLIRSGLKKPECEQCGYKERRITDNKVPLLLNFLDDNPHNHVLDNLKLYCFNCTFMCGRGYIRNGKHVFDPDHLQGAEKEDIDNESRF